jgi:glutathione S-transferase
MRCELEQPCFKVVDCWWETFDIVRYLQEHLPEERLARVMDARPKPKVASLVEMIAQTKARMQE